MTKSTVWVALIAVAALCITTAVPAMANAEESSAESTTLVGNVVSSTGAVAGDGDQNTAVGASVVIVNGDANIVDGFGALAVGGDGNTAIGVNSQVIDGDYNKAIGFGATAGGGSYNTAIGRGTIAAYGDGNTALGAESWALGGLNTAVGAASVAYGGSSVALGAFSVADQPMTVSVGQPGYERRITNVAPGVYDTDAVNMSQLRSMGSRLDNLGATAMAMTGLAPMGYNPKDPTQYSAAVGTYNGKQAIALGVFHYTKERVMLNAAFGWSTDKWEKAGRVGITWTGGGAKKADADNTVHVSNLPGQPNGEQSSQVPEGGIQDRVNKLLRGSSVQANQSTATSSGAVQESKPVSAEVKVTAKKPAEKKPAEVPEGGIQDRVNKLLNSYNK